MPVEIATTLGYRMTVESVADRMRVAGKSEREIWIHGRWSGADPERVAAKPIRRYVEKDAPTASRAVLG